MGWLRDWKRRRILKRHRIDDVLWRRAQEHLPFLRGLTADQERRLKDFAVVFLAEKQLAPVRGLVLTEDDRVEIAPQRRPTRNGRGRRGAGESEAPSQAGRAAPPPGTASAYGSRLALAVRQ